MTREGNSMFFRQMTFVAILYVVCVANTNADEIQLKPTVQCSGSIVYLKDIASIETVDSQRQKALENIELFPVPGNKKAVDANQVRQLLANNDVNMLTTHVSGASVVILIPPTQSLDIQRDNFTTIKTGLIADTSKVKPAAFEQMPARIVPPQKEIDLRNVIVAAVPISAGETIHRDQLTWAPATAQWDNQWVTDFTQIVGKQARCPISPMRPLNSRDFQKAIVVQRNQECRVVSVFGNVRVSTMAKAKQDGAIGDFIEVQSLDRKRTYHGEVTGSQTITISNQTR
jgi:flagella basal body P-ring formation protein FlgA